MHFMTYDINAFSTLFALCATNFIIQSVKNSQRESVNEFAKSRGWSAHVGAWLSRAPPL